MSIETIAFEQAVRLLKSIKYNFIITDAQGTVVATQGDLQLAVAEKAKRRSPSVKLGTYSDIYKPYINAMTPGDVWKFPAPKEIDLEGLRSSAVSYAVEVFGRGNVMSTIDRDTHSLELLVLEA
jgi:hypothetical protein